jgi:hypothetical protein
MGAREAAALMIAINAADNPRAAPEAVQRFSDLRWEDFPEGKNDPLRDLLSGKNFGDALAALLEHMPRLVRELLADPVLDERSKRYLLRNPVWLSIKFERPCPSARIFFRVDRARKTREFFAIWSSENENVRSLFRSSTAEVYAPTLLQVSRVLAPEEWETIRPPDEDVH